MDGAVGGVVVSVVGGVVASVECRRKTEPAGPTELKIRPSEIIVYMYMTKMVSPIPANNETLERCFNAGVIVGERCSLADRLGEVASMLSGLLLLASFVPL